MTKKEAQEEYLKLLHERIAITDKIIEEAKANGTWLPGLDSNNYLFKDVEKQFWEKVLEIRSKVDEE